MGIFNKFTSKIGLSDSEEERRLKEELAEDEQEEDEEAYDEDEEEEEEERVPNFEGTGGHDFGRNVVDFTSAVSARDGSGNAKLKVVVIEPRSFDDAQQVANALREKRPVVLNFENTDGESARRIIDFISGTTYALNGEIKKVGRNVFICAPNNVNVSIEEEHRSGADMPWLKK